MLPRVSIIIPLHNKSQYIESTLKSVLAQSMGNWECIIIDDGSTDGSYAIVKEFIATHPGNWKVISQANQGQTLARNNGAQIAIAPIIAFLDADDLWMPQKLEKQLSLIESTGISLVLCSYLIINEQNEYIRLVRFKDSNRLLRNWATLRGFGGGLESGGLIKKSDFQLVGGFDSRFSSSSGLDLSLRLSQIGDVSVVRDVGFVYRFNSSGFHTQYSELERNLEILQDRYPESEHFLGLQRNHNAFIYWAKLREGTKIGLAVGLLQSLMGFKIFRICFFLRVIWRNLLAVISGAKYIGKKAKYFASHDINMTL